MDSGLLLKESGERMIEDDEEYSYDGARIIDIE